jgi:recombination protein RecT
MDNRDAQFLALLGSPEAVARFKTVALHAVTSRPDLLRCEKMSIIEAIREAASLDLEPTGVLGEAWLIPYKGMAKLRIGWQGHLKLIRRSGEVASVDCQVVYQNDRFELQLGTDPRIVHEPALKDRGDYRGAYAWARLKSGDLIIEWLPVEDVAPIRKIAAADSLMWDTFPGEGMRKSAIRRLQKRLPKSQHIEQALKVEAEAEEAPAALPTPARQAARAALEARFGNDDAGEPEPETANQEPEAVADAPATSTAPTGEICEALPGDSPLGLTAYCNKPAGHDGMHASDEGSWPR